MLSNQAPLDSPCNSGALGRFGTAGTAGTAGTVGMVYTVS